MQPHNDVWIPTPPTEPPSPSRIRQSSFLQAVYGAQEGLDLYDEDDEATRELRIHLATLHRAAEVHRWQWLRDRGEGGGDEERSNDADVTPLSGYTLVSPGAAPPWRAPSPIPSSPSSSSSSSSADSMDSARPRHMGIVGRSPRNTRARQDLAVWNRMCYDLGKLAGCCDGAPSDSEDDSVPPVPPPSIQGFNTPTRIISGNTAYVYNSAVHPSALFTPSEYQHIDRATCQRWYPGAAGAWLWHHLRQRNLDAFHSTARNANANVDNESDNSRPIWARSGPTRETSAQDASPMAPWADPWALYERDRQQYRTRQGAGPAAATTTTTATPTTVDTHPASAFQVPPAAASLSNRLTAAQEVSRMADQARRFRSLRAETLARNAAAQRTNGATATPATPPHRDSQGMQLIRTLRDLDGVGAQSSDDAHVAPDPPQVQPWQLFPWYTPSEHVQSARPPTAPSHTPSLTDHPDPNGDGVRGDWYRGVRARMLNARAQENARRAALDPNGELEQDSHDGADSAPAPAPAPTPRPQTMASSRHLRRRHRSAIVLSAPDDEEAGDGDASPSDHAEGWTLITPSSPFRDSQDSTTRYLERSSHGGEAVDGLLSPDPQGTNTLSQSRFRLSPVAIGTTEGQDPTPGTDTNGSQIGIWPPVSDTRTIRRPRRLGSLTDQDIPPLAIPPSSSDISSRAQHLRSVTQSIQRELSARQAELRASRQRVAVELAQNRQRLDEARRRERRIGRVLERAQGSAANASLASAAAAPSSTVSHSHSASARATTSDDDVEFVAESRYAESRHSAPGPSASGHSAPSHSASTHTASSHTAPTSTGSTSLVRRRTVRDSAPGLRAPRSLRAARGRPGARTTSTMSTSTVQEEVVQEPHTQARPPSQHPAYQAPPIPRDPLRRARSLVTLQRTPTTGRDFCDDMGLHSSAARSHLITRQDEVRLGSRGYGVLCAIDAGAMRDEYLHSVAQVLLDSERHWAPAQPAFGDNAMDTAYPLRFEISSDTSSSAQALDVLRNDQASLPFDAAQGLELELRFLAAVPAVVESSAAGATASRQPYPTDRREEDRAWDQARRNVIRGGNSSGSREAAINEARGALGMPPREARPTDRTPEGGSRVDAARPTRPEGGSRVDTTRSRRQTNPELLRPEEIEILQRMLVQLDRWREGDMNALDERFDGGPESIGDMYMRDGHTTLRAIAESRRSGAGQAAVQAAGESDAGDGESDTSSGSGSSSDGSESTVRAAETSSEPPNRTNTTQTQAARNLQTFPGISLTTTQHTLLRQILSLPGDSTTSILLHSSLLTSRSKSIATYQRRLLHRINPDLSGPVCTFDTVTIKVKLRGQITIRAHVYVSLVESANRRRKCATIEFKSDTRESGTHTCNVSLGNGAMGPVGRYLAVVFEPLRAGAGSGAGAGVEVGSARGAEGGSGTEAGSGAVGTGSTRTLGAGVELVHIGARGWPLTGATFSVPSSCVR